jgi:hypothetical protein
MAAEAGQQKHATLRRVTVVLAALWLLQTGWAAWGEGWTADEPNHLRWSARLWSEGVAERTSFHWFDSTTPISIIHVLGQRAAERAGLGPRAVKFAARLPSVAFGAGVLLLVFVLGRELIGERGGCLAVAGTALDPNLVAHSSLATVDAAFACATMAVLLSSVRVMARPSLPRAALVGVAFGLALTAKFAALFLVPGLLWLLWRPRWEGVAGLHAAGARLVAVAVAALAIVAVLASAYLFHDVGRRLDAVEWSSAPLRGLAALAPGLRLPLPTGLLTGLDLSLAHERGSWNVVLLGRLHPSGVWYYYSFLWLIKTPVLLLAAQVYGLVRGVKTGAALRNDGLRLIAFDLVILLGYFSFFYRAQIGYRHVLMCVPLAYLLAAAGLDFGEKSGRGPRLAGLAVVAASLAEGLAYLGNPISFSNSFVWPKRDAYKLMADSNLDWGQNDDDLAALLARHGLSRATLNPLHLLAGRNTLRVNDVAGVADFEQHRWLREHVEPSEILGHTHLRFDIDAATFSRFMDEARSVEPDGAALCTGSQPLEPTPAGSRLPVELAGPPDPDRMWIWCVAADKGADVGLRSLEGHARFGPRGPDGCRWETVEQGQVSWWRLKPGRHALCLDDIPNRRPWLPYRFDGLLIVRGRAVALARGERAVAEADAVSPAPSP